MISIKIGDKLTEWKKIFTGVRQCCSLSPLLFNMYMNEIIKEFRYTKHSLICIIDLQSLSGT
jgi:Reverse transcriptase (RNA-dependent DNA polymerase).